LNLAWLESVQADLPAGAMRFCSMAHPFPNLQPCSLAATITDLEVVAVAVNKVGWTTMSTTDSDINPGIKYLESIKDRFNGTSVTLHSCESAFT